MTTPSHNAPRNLADATTPRRTPPWWLPVDRDAHGVSPAGVAVIIACSIAVLVALTVGA